MPTQLPTTQAQSVLYYLQKLDLDMLETVLLDRYTYQDMAKSMFIGKLSQVFDQYLSAGDQMLNAYPGQCNNEECNFSCTGMRFIGDKSKYALDLIIDIKDEVVTDIYECHDFTCASKCKVKRKLEIDPDELPF